jgi:hypothetical protein
MQQVAIRGESRFMNFIRHVFLLVLASCLLTAALVPASALADVEGALTLSNIRLDSQGIDKSGPIHIDGTQSERGISTLTVSAFGKRLTLSASQLATLGSRTFNSIGLSYSQGYPNTGGRTVYLLLCHGFSSGMKVIAVIAVNEQGGVRVEAAKVTGG